jgi:hypothetical protein
MKGPLIQLPGTKGTIQIHYDLATGQAQLDAAQIALPDVIQILLSVAKGAAAQWAAIDAQIIRPGIQKTGENHGNEETGDQKNDDDNG